MNTLPFDLPKYCKIIENSLIVKKSNKSDFWFYSITYLAMFILIFWMFIGEGGGGIIAFLFIGGLLIQATITFVVPFYFPHVTRINFETGRVDMKGVFFSRWKSFSITNGNIEPTSISRFHLTPRPGIMVWYSDVNLNFDDRSYCIRQYQDISKNKVHPEAEFLYAYLRKGFENKNSPSDILKVMKS